MKLKPLRTLAISTVITAGLLTWIGCDGGTNEPNAPNEPPGGFAGPGGPGNPGPGGPGPERNSSPIKAIMVKLDRGPWL